MSPGDARSRIIHGHHVHTAVTFVTFTGRFGDCSVNIYDCFFPKAFTLLTPYFLPRFVYRFLQFIDAVGSMLKK
jgi:hypothetical protein